MTEKRFTIVDDYLVSYDGDYFDLHKPSNIRSLVTVANYVVDENEQLKQRNTRQAKQLDRLYNLIEQKDWRALNDILDDFKRCEEQLQREWGTYGDVE